MISADKNNDREPFIRILRGRDGNENFIRTINVFHPRDADIDSSCPISAHPSREERQRHCQTPPPEGHCKENPAQKFRFHSQSNKCQAFTYTGCGADYNVFDDERACMTYCTQADPERDAPQAGKCYFGGANYEVGSVLQTEPQYTCTCSIPPEFTCLMRT